MYKHQRIQPRFQEKRLYTQRAIVGIGIIALMILVLLSRIAYLQITDHQKYAMLSERNQLRLVPIAPTRGLIFDRNGKLLARNVPAFHLAIIPEQVPELDKTLEELSQLIPIADEQREALLERIHESPSHQRQYIKLKLTEEEVSTFAVNQYRFPGFFLQVDLIRDYPYGAILAHILGYVSEANKEELGKNAMAAPTKSAKLA